MADSSAPKALANSHARRLTAESRQLRRSTFAAQRPDSAELLVEAHDLGRVYEIGGVPIVALAAVTCQVSPGDRIAIIGPSGSGKSTLLHLMAGLDQATTGQLAWPALGSPAALRPTKI